jgi:putative transcriptional regulator
VRPSRSVDRAILAYRGRSTLAERVGITPANLAVLKNGRAKAVRFSTLAALCEALECQPGDLLRWEPDHAHKESPIGRLIP